MYKIYTKYHTKNACYKRGQKVKMVGVLVHSTGANNPYLSRYVDDEEHVGRNKYNNHWNVEYPAGRSVCVHSFIGYDKNNEIAIENILPYDIACWGCGSGSKGSYNFNPAYIQFEICEDSLRDKNYYNKVMDCAAWYCAKLCFDLDIDIDNITCHSEACRAGYASNHGDIEHWLKIYGHTMDDFRGWVRNHYNKMTEETKEDKKYYRVQFGAFSKKANAVAFAEKMKAQGIDCIIKYY